MDYTFKGFYSPLKGNTIELYDAEIVRRDILNIFNTKKGERVMNSNYGFVGWDMLFELRTDFNQFVIEDDIDNIINSDPRVTLIEKIITKEEYGFTIELTLQYVNIGVDNLIINFTENMVR